MTDGFLWKLVEVKRGLGSMKDKGGEIGCEGVEFGLYHIKVVLDPQGMM